MVCSVCLPHLKQVERPAVPHGPKATLTQDQRGRGPDTKRSASVRTRINASALYFKH